MCFLHTYATATTVNSLLSSLAQKSWPQVPLAPVPPSHWPSSLFYHLWCAYIFIDGKWIDYHEVIVWEGGWSSISWISTIFLMLVSLPSVFPGASASLKHKQSFRSWGAFSHLTEASRQFWILLYFLNIDLNNDNDWKLNVLAHVLICYYMRVFCFIRN